MGKDNNKSKVKGLLIRIGLIVGAVAVILVMLPRADHQSYSFEMNQPWKYPLLTAEFDTPVLRDSTSIRELRDSINTNFIPFVKRNPDLANMKLQGFAASVADSVPSGDESLLEQLLVDVYARGVMETNVGRIVEKMPYRRVREANPKDATQARTTDASAMLTAGEAYEYIDSTYNAFKGTPKGALSPFLARALYSAIDANVLLDTVTDEKYRSQALLEITAALGVIKQGQRIVDRGEIVTPQIYTNLTTYMELLEEQEEENLSQLYYTIGRGIVVLVILVTLFIFLHTYRREFYESARNMSFLTIYITLFVIFAILMFEYVANGISLVPFAAVPVVIMIFFDSGVALGALLATVLISSLVATFPQQFIIMEMMAGVIAALSINQLSRRSQLLITAFLTFVVYSVVYVGMFLVRDGSFEGLDYRLFGYYAVNAVILSFAYVLIVVMEKVFGFTSNVTLVELSDINNSLLRRLAEEAPGTFQHSVQVSTLAAEAARAIGANTQLVRTGALYHDIGKLSSPVFYTENQHGVNPHSGLDPETSARKIISHITEGMKLANKDKLPSVIKDFIAQHHGAGVAKYFYNTAVNERGEENVDVADFTYPGPDPQTKETAILMMADAVEAASRSLKDYSTESITNLVNKIIDGQLAEGRFHSAPISFRDIEKIKQTFIKRLGTIYHARVSYPELRKQAIKETHAADAAEGKTEGFNKTDNHSVN